jgi:iron uptake system EfeUOB component EfeO/EfeM
MDYRRQKVYDELKQIKEELNNAVTKTIDNYGMLEKLNNAYKNKDQFEMFNLVSVIIDENLDLLAKVSWLDMSKDWAFAEDLNLGDND